MKKKLTAIAIPGLPVGQYPDSLTPGLILRVGPRRKTWECRYRRGSKRHADRIGYYPAMTLQKARETAADLLKRIDTGLPAAAPAPAVHPRSAPTLDDLFTRYERLREAEGHRTKRLRRSMMTLRHCLKRWLATPAHEFSKADLRVARDIVAENAPSQANALLRNLGPVMKWAAQEELVPTNFVPDLRKSPGKKRNRVLSGEELRAIWRACDDLGSGPVSRSFGRMVRFLMVSGCRLGEAAALKHGDLLDGTWRQTPESNKSGRKHSLPLPRMALDQLGEGKANELCFPGKHGQLSGFSKMKAQLDEACGVRGWIIHDLRRSFVSGLGDLGIDELTIKATINHAVATGALSHYLHSELEKQKRAALQAWADKLARIVGGKLAVS